MQLICANTHAHTLSLTHAHIFQLLCMYTYSLTHGLPFSLFLTSSFSHVNTYSLHHKYTNTLSHTPTRTSFPFLRRVFSITITGKKSQSWTSAQLNSIPAKIQPGIKSTFWKFKHLDQLCPFPQ